MHGVGFIGAIIIGVFAGWIAEKVMKAAFEKAHDYEKRCVCVRCGECRVWSWM